MELNEPELELINRKVAEIAGWTDIKVWNPKAIKKTLVGTNLAHPEMGIFIPNYVGSLDAIWKVFECLNLKDFQIAECSGVDEIGGSYEALQCIGSHEILTQYGETPVIALCKLLIVINPDPIKPTPNPERESVEQVESNVVEASFA